MYDNLLIDLDGTISDNSEGILKGVRDALEYFNIDYKEEELYEFIGPPLLDSFMNGYGLDEDSANKAIEIYREHYKTKGLFENKLYKDIEKVLKDMKSKGKRLFICTAKPEFFARKILAYFGIDNYFDDIYGATLTNERIHKDDIIGYCIFQNNLDKSITVMIGDRSHDICGAKKHGISSIGVTYGFGSRDELQDSGADEIVDSFSELLNLI
ncbi:MAG: HAD-IA family hydrolase [Tissierellia bacterium]|nr:HAD-IA family hydrolase [Tissierellia bacterium]